MDLKLNALYGLECIFETEMSMPVKIVRVFFVNGKYMIDYRQTAYGKLSNDGLLLNYLEWSWLKDALCAGDLRDFVNDGRTLTVTGNEKLPTISLEDENGYKNKITFYNNDELRIFSEKHVGISREIDKLMKWKEKCSLFKNNLLNQ